MDHYDDLLRQLDRAVLDRLGREDHAATNYRRVEERIRDLVEENRKLRAACRQYREELAARADYYAKRPDHSMGGSQFQTYMQVIAKFDRLIAPHLGEDS